MLRSHRRRGVGTALLADVSRIADELHAWRIRLNADPSNGGVRAFYEALGFRDHADGFFQKDV